MAVFNEILVGRYNRFFQKFFGIKGPPPTPQLASELIPVFPMFHGRENRYLEGWATLGGTAFIGAVAAQDSAVRLTNPGGRNVIAVVESILVWMGVANGNVLIEYQATGNPGILTGGTVTPANFDGRFNPPGTGGNQAACSLSVANNVAQGSHIAFNNLAFTAAGQVSNEFINFESQEIQLLPGASLQFRTVTLNTSLDVSLRWRERALEESEVF